MLLPYWFFFFGQPQPLVPTRRFSIIAPRWIYSLIAPRWNYSLVAPQWIYSIIFPGSRMPALRNPPPLDVGVPQTVTGDFGNFLPPGVTLLSTQAHPLTVTISLVPGSGTDPNPPSRLTSAPAIGTDPVEQGGTGQTDTAILQQFTLLAATYLVWMTCGRSDSNDEVSGWFHISGVTPQ